MDVRRWYFTTVLLFSLPLFMPASGVAEEQKAAAPSGQPSSGTLAVPSAEQSSEAARTTDTYTIKQGDTLWDISSQFLKDPFLWPLIWKVNPSIANADLIYPGNALVIPSLTPIEQAISAPVPAKETTAEAAPAAPAPAPAAVREAPSESPFQGKSMAEAEQEKTASRLVIPERTPTPIVDKYTMLNAGFVVKEDEPRDVVVGAMEEKTIFSYDDVLLLKMHSNGEVNIGDKLLIYEVGQKIKHPATGKNFGKLIRALGIVQVTAKEPSGIVSARVTLSFDYIEKGDFVAPYVEPTLVYSPNEQRTKDITGYVLAVRDMRTLNGQLDFAYLDKGAADGVEQGDRFTVYLNPEKPGFPKKIIGEAQVFLVKDKTATALIRKSTDAITAGDRITFKQ